MEVIEVMNSAALMKRSEINAMNEWGNQWKGTTRSEKELEREGNHWAQGKER